MADWEIFDGKSTQGPFSEQALADSIRRGLPPTVLVREVGAAEWRNMREHGPFAVALLSAPQVAPPPPPPPAAPQTIIQRVNVTGGNGCANACGLLILLVLLLFLGPLCVGMLLK
jgi:hypothetical protein